VPSAPSSPPVRNGACRPSASASARGAGPSLAWGGEGTQSGGASAPALNR
jgi:hypothetical protein